MANRIPPAPSVAGCSSPHASTVTQRSVSSILRETQRPTTAALSSAATYKNGAEDAYCVHVAPFGERRHTRAPGGASTYDSGDNEYRPSGMPDPAGSAPKFAAAANTSSSAAQGC